MSGLELNKIAASVLVAGLVGMIVSKTASSLYHPETNPKERGYRIEVTEDAASTSAPAAAAAPVDIAAFLADTSAEKGAGLTKACVTCHSFEKGGPDKVGPNLWGVVGNHRAHKQGYAYSKAFTDQASKTWDFQALSEYLTKPAAYIPGNKMAFAGIKKPEERAAVIAYLNSLSDRPLPIPPAPAAK